MDVEIIKKDSNSFLLSNYDIYAKDFIVSSIELEPHYSEVENRSGLIDNGATYKSRTITVPFYIKAHDLHDYALLRDELFNLVVSRESFYIRELRRTKYQAYEFVDTNESPRNDKSTENKYVGGKRYKVRIANVIELEQSLTFGEGELEFETTELPYAESIGTTADIDKNGLRYSDELWSYGMGLSYESETHKYTHNTKTFRIYNAGNVEEIEPFEMDLKITVEGINGPYELKNESTGDVFKYTGSNSGKLLLDGPNVTLNGLQAFRDTNRRYISLAHGWNTFTQSQTKKVSFDFRYYYK